MAKLAVLALLFVSACGLSVRPPRILDEQFLAQLFADGWVSVDLVKLVKELKVSVSEGSWFDETEVKIQDPPGATADNIGAILKQAVKYCQDCVKSPKNRSSTPQYTYAVCTLTSDTVCGDCGVKPTGKYEKKACNSGQPLTLGSAAEYEDCTEPTADQFVTAVCGNSNTVTTECNRPSAIQYVARKCDSGSSSRLGSNAVLALCKRPSATEYVTQKCGLESDTVIASCTEPTGDWFIQTVCSPGDYNAVGADAVLKQCKGPGANEFVHTVCSRTTDTVIAQCLTAPTETFIAVACVPGLPKTAGTNSVIQNCTKAVTDNYVDKVCGTTTDTVFRPCSKAGPNEYVASACVLGNALQAGTDTVIRQCSNPTSGNYVTAVCSATSDTATAPCSTPAPGAFTSPCNPGSSTQVGANIQTLQAKQVACGSTTQGTTEASRKFFGDSVYTFSSTEELREFSIGTCGSDTVFSLFTTPSNPIPVTTSPCAGSQGVQGSVNLPAGTYTIVVNAAGTTAGSYQLTVQCALSAQSAQQRFQFFREEMTYDQGKALCASKGMSLAQVTSAEEVAVAVKLVKDSGLKKAYLGINDIVEEGLFMLSIFDEPIVYSNWAPGEPNNAGRIEDCVEQYEDGRWNDIPCDARRPILCSAFRPSRVATTATQQFVHFPGTSSTYENARQTCLANGMRLAHITSSAENDAVKGLIASAATVWIGINDMEINDYWAYTAYSTPIVYTQWAPNEPNNFQNTHEACVQMYTNGNWNDLPCSRTLAFACSAYLPTISRGNLLNQFVFFDRTVDYLGAQQLCAANGMSVAHITNSLDVGNLTSLFTTVPREPVWIGVFTQSGSRVSDMFKAPVTFNNFAPGAPTRSDFCVQSDVSGQWTDVACDSTRRVVCSAFRDRVTTISNGLRFVIMPRTIVNYNQALDHCRSQGMTLAHAIPKAQDSLGKLVQAFPDMNAWVGVDDLRNKFTWRYALTTVPATRSRWSAGEPNNAGGNEDCVEINSQGNFNDNRCDANRRPICSAFLGDREVRSSRRFVVLQLTSPETSCNDTGLWSDVPKSTRENEDVTRLLRRFPGLTRIGGFRRQTDNRFISEFDQQLLTFTNWAAGEPNDVGQIEDCVDIRSNGQWNDRRCDSSWVNFVCLVATP